MNKRYNLSTKKTVFGLTFVLLSILFLAYNAGMNSSIEALSDNSNLTITETTKGYAFHEPKDDWVYGRDEYTELIPYEEDRGELISEENEIVVDISDEESLYVENSSDEESYDTESSNTDIQEDDVCGLTYDPEKGFLEVVSCTNDNGHITYRMYDYLSDTTFIVQLFNGEIEQCYTDNLY